jgi:hypothetical protein
VLTPILSCCRSYENHSPSTTQTGNGTTNHNDHGGLERNGPDQLLSVGKREQIDVSIRIEKENFKMVLLVLSVVDSFFT